MNRFKLACLLVSTAVETDAIQNVAMSYDELAEEDYDYQDADTDTGKGKAGKGEVPSPTVRPTVAPTVRPTLAPTVAPTFAPTVQPTPAPTASPTQSPPVWTGWVNSWDQEVNWQASAGGYVMTGVHSKHHNSYEDRLWDFQQSKLLASTSPVLTGYVNDWDQEFTYGDDSRVFVGMYSVHDNNKEDRRFKIYQSSHGVAATGCYWTGETNWDAEWTIQAHAGEAITGMWSRHDNGKEDRLFKFRFCKLGSPVPTAPPTPAPPTATWTGWVNSWDQPVDWQANAGSVMTGVHSKHDNSKEDRLWDFQQYPLLATTSPVLTDFVNNWDQEFTYGDDSRAFVGMYSVHHNSYEDRRFKIYQTFHGKTATGCYWTGETNWDAEWTIQGRTGEAVTGMWSRHDNGKEDRLFKFRFCTLA